MEGPCKECWAQVDPYECWNCAVYMDFLKTNPYGTSEDTRCTAKQEFDISKEENKDESIC